MMTDRPSAIWEYTLGKRYGLPGLFSWYRTMSVTIGRAISTASIRFMPKWLAMVSS